MSTAPPKPVPPPPPPKQPGRTAPAAVTSFNGEFEISSGRSRGIGDKVVVYGTGGIGKSELCANISKLGMRPRFFDLDGGTKHLPVERIAIHNWMMLRTAIQRKDFLEGYDALVIDDLTKAEEYAGGHVVATKKTKGGGYVDNIEDYGWGDGLGYRYNEFIKMLGDLDAVARDGKVVLCVAHDTTATAVNPAGENFVRYEPRLQSPKGGNDSIRARVKEWCDHLVFIGYDQIVEKGKATGGGSRTIYTNELPMCLAKSRTLKGEIPYEQGSAKLWEMMFVQGQGE